MALVIAPALAGARSHLAADRIEAGGLVLERLSCDVDDPAPTPAALLAALPRRRLLACGARAFAVEIEWTKTAMKRANTGDGRPTEKRCMERELMRARLPTSGACTLTLRLGDGHEAHWPDDVRAALDQHLDAPAVRHLIGSLAGMRRTDDTFENGDFYYQFQSDGVSLHFHADEVLVGIILSGPADITADAFAGTLDGGVTLRDRRATVEEKWGAPTRTGGGGFIGVWALYANAWRVSYEDTKGRDRQSHIHDVAISRSEVRAR